MGDIYKGHQIVVCWKKKKKFSSCFCWNGVVSLYQSSATEQSFGEGIITPSFSSVEASGDPRQTDGADLSLPPCVELHGC